MPEVTLSDDQPTEVFFSDLMKQYEERFDGKVKDPGAFCAEVMDWLMPIEKDRVTPRKWTTRVHVPRAPAARIVAERKRQGRLAPDVTLDQRDERF